MLSKVLLDSGVLSEPDLIDSNIDIGNIANEPLDKEEKAKINTELMINPDEALGSGCVYEETQGELSEYLSRLLKSHKSDGNNSCKAIKLDVTPVCDNAQKKNIFYYFVHGIIAPEHRKAKKHPYIYEFQHPFMYEGEMVKLVFNLRLFQTILKPKTKEAPIGAENLVLFKLRDNIVFDIQQKIAGHNTRMGHTLLS